MKIVHKSQRPQKWLQNYITKKLSDQADAPPRYRFLYEVFADRYLTSTEKLLAVIQWMYANEHNKAWPCQPLLAWLANCNANTVRRSIRHLERRGFLATVTGCKGRTSEYTLLIHGQGLDEARKRTADEIFQILYPDASEPLTPSPVRGSTPHQCRPHLPIDLSKESTLGQASGEDTSPLSHRRPPIREAKGRRAKVSKGEPSFEFLPSQGRLDDVFWSGNPDDTHCLSDSTIVQGLRRAASGRIGRALQTEAGLDTVRQMAASVTAELECSPQEAFHLIQRRIWDRIGSRPGEWLNCYGLLFVPLCNSLDLQDVEIGHQDQCRAALAALDVDGRIDLELLFGPSTYELSGLLLEFEEAQIIAATAMALAANNSQIHGFSYLREFITEPRSESDATARHHTYART